MRLKVGNMRLISNWRSWVLGPDTISFNQNSYEASAWLGFTSVGPGAEHSTGASIFVTYMMLSKNIVFRWDFSHTLKIGSSRQSRFTMLFHGKKADTISATDEHEQFSQYELATIVPGIF